MPTFGIKTIGSSGGDGQVAANVESVSKLLLFEPGTLTKLSMYTTHGASDSPMLQVVYADDHAGGGPSTYLGQSDAETVALAHAPGWFDWPFTSTIHLAAAGFYWMGPFSGTTGWPTGWYTTSIGAGAYSTTATYPTPASPFGTLGVEDFSQRSLYGTYTADVADTTAPVAAITSPAAGPVTGSVAVATHCTDNVNVVSVDLLVNGIVIQTATATALGQTSFPFTLNTLAYREKATISLTVTAHDPQGNTGTSAAVAVTVANCSLPAL